jgi:tyrosinase
MNVGNEAWYPNFDPSKYDSFESVHDVVHMMMGGSNNGNMNIITISAFDPAFWLHHTNIDRLFAMWQSLYPNSYLEPQAQEMATYWYKAGSVQDVNSPLKPFYADTQGNFHTSASVRDLTTLGYTYPELTSGDPADVRSAINVLYGDAEAKQNQKRSFLRYLYKARPTNGTDAAPNRQYIANIRADKVGQDTSYAVRIFLGDFTADPQGWAKDPNLVGTHSVFAKQMAKGAYPVPVSGAVMLNKRLQKLCDEKKISALTQDVVRLYLKQNLHWRVQRVSPQAM